MMLLMLGLSVLQAVIGGAAVLGWVLCLFGAAALLLVTAFYRGRGYLLRTDDKATVSAAGTVAFILMCTLRMYFLLVLYLLSCLLSFQKTGLSVASLLLF